MTIGILFLISVMSPGLVFAQSAPPGAEAAQQATQSSAPNAQGAAMTVEQCIAGIRSKLGTGLHLSPRPYTHWATFDTGPELSAQEICQKPGMLTPEGQQAFQSCSQDLVAYLIPNPPKTIARSEYSTSTECFDPAFQQNLPKVLSCASQARKKHPKFGPALAFFTCSQSPSLFTDKDQSKKFDACFDAFRQWKIPPETRAANTNPPPGTARLANDWNPGLGDYSSIKGKESQEQWTERNSSTEAIIFCAGAKTGPLARSPAMVDCIKHYQLSGGTKNYRGFEPSRVFSECAKQLGYPSDAVSGGTPSTTDGQGGSGPGDTN